MTATLLRTDVDLIIPVDITLIPTTYLNHMVSEIVQILHVDSAVDQNIQVLTAKYCSRDCSANGAHGIGYFGEV